MIVQYSEWSGSKMGKYKKSYYLVSFLLYFMRISSSSDSYRQSLFPRILWDWDALPTNIIELPAVDQFKGTIYA